MGHFPAIDVLASKSRVMHAICDEAQRRDAAAVRGWMAAYKKSELLIRLGEYRAGTDPELDQAVARQDAIRAFLRQARQEAATLDQTREALRLLAAA
jgi:type III secretion protein N (ATPase)